MMDNDGSIEEEQLKKDILQINQVLGNNDGEGEGEFGDDSDSEYMYFEIDEHEREADDRSINELKINGSQSQESLKNESLGEHTGARHEDASEECCVEQLLILNQDGQRSLQELLIRVREELHRNQEEQAKVSANPSEHETRNVNLSVRAVFRDYLEDGLGKSPPDNVETKKKKAAAMPNPFEIPRMKWKTQQHEKLQEGVRIDGLKRKMQPLLNRQEVLEAKMDRLSLPKDLEKAYEEIRQIKKELAKIETLPTSQLLGDRLREADWEFIANVDLESARTADECQSQWQNRLHPSICHEMWSEKEKEDLMMTAGVYQYRDWEEIAEELGTSRTALQSLRMFQQLDTTFVKSNFTQEDDELLLELVQRLQVGTKFIPFPKIAYFMEGKTKALVSYRWMKKIDPSLRSGKWSQEETKKLKKLVECHGAKNWARMADELPGRTQFQIRHRWAATIDPRIKHGSWDYPETFAFLEKTQELGVGNWSKIAQALKKPSEKARTPINILGRFKQVIKSYTIWKQTVCSGEPRNKRSRNDDDEIDDDDDEIDDDDDEIDDEKLYSGTILPKVVAFLHDRQKREVEKAKQKVLTAQCTVRESLGVNRKTKRKRRQMFAGKDSDEDDECSDDSLSQSNDPPTLTQRQVALALKREQGHENTQDIEKITSRRGRKRMGLRDENQESETDHTACTELPPATSRVKDLDDDLTSNEELDNEVVDPRDAKNDDEDDDDEDDDEEDPDSDTGDIAPDVNQSRSPLRQRGLSGWLKKLKESNAARAVHYATRSRRINPKEKSAYKAKHNSIFDVPDSIPHVHLMRAHGQKTFTRLDTDLTAAVNPMWLCRRGSGRQSKHSLKAQERTRQEKLHPIDQKAVFAILLQVFDVDVNYTAALAKRSINISNWTKDLAAKQSITQEPSGVKSAKQTATSGPPAVVSGSQEVTSGLQGATSGPEGLTNGSQGVTSGPHVVTSSPHVVTSSLQQVISVNQTATSGPHSVSSGLHRVTSGQNRMTSGSETAANGAQSVTVNSQEVSNCQQAASGGQQTMASGQQTMASGQQTMASGQQAVTSGLNVWASGPQISTNASQINYLQGMIVGLQTAPSGLGVIRSPQVLTSGLQGVNQGVTNIPLATGHQTVPSGLGIISGPRVLASGLQGVQVPLTSTNFPQALIRAPQGVTIFPQGMTIGPQALTIFPQAVTILPQGLTSCSQVLASSQQGVTSGQESLIGGPQIPMSGPQGVAHVPQGLTTFPQRLTSDPEILTSGLQAVANSQVLTSDPQGVTGDPQEVTSDPQEVTSDPQEVTSDPQVLTSDPQEVTSGLQEATSGLQKATSGLQEVTSGLQDVTSGPQVLTSDPQGVTSDPQDVTSDPQEVTSDPQEVTSDPQVATSDPQVATSDPQVATSDPQVATSDPQVATSDPQVATSDPQVATSDPQVATSDPQVATSDPQVATSDPQVATSDPQVATSDPQVATSDPQVATSDPQVATSDPQVATSDPQVATSGLQEVTSGPQVLTSDPQGVTIEQVSDTATDTGVALNQSSPSLLQHWNSGTVPRLNTPVGSQQNTRHAPNAPKLPQTQYLLLQNNQTGQYVAKTNPSESMPNGQAQVSLPNRMPTVPILLSGPTLNAPSQLWSPQNLPGQLTQSYFTLPHQPLSHDKSGSIQVPIHQVEPAINVVSQQVHGTPPPQSVHTNALGNPPVTLQVPLPGVQAVSPFISPAPSSSSSSSAAPNACSTQFVHLPSHDGSKIVLTVDQYRSYMAGNLGNVTCNVFVPVIKAEKGLLQSGPCHSESARKIQRKENQPENEQRRKQNQSEREHVELDPNSAIHVDSSLPTTGRKKYPRKRTVKPLKRKLHSKDISLLPPNVATIQALTSLLLDRNQLESQRKNFISKFAKRLEKKQEVEKVHEVCFRGYLESRNVAEGGLSQAGQSQTMSSISHQESTEVQENDGAISLEPTNAKQSADSDASCESPSSSKSVEDHLAILRKTDSYQVLQRRFLSLFLWPGLLSSTRIKGSVNILGASSFCVEQPAKVQPVQIKQASKSSACSKQK